MANKVGAVMDQNVQRKVMIGGKILISVVSLITAYLSFLAIVWQSIGLALNELGIWWFDLSWQSTFLIIPIGVILHLYGQYLLIKIAGLKIMTMLCLFSAPALLLIHECFVQILFKAMI